MAATELQPLFLTPLIIISLLPSADFMDSLPFAFHLGLKLEGPNSSLEPFSLAPAETTNIDSAFVERHSLASTGSLPEDKHYHLTVHLQIWPGIWKLGSILCKLWHWRKTPRWPVQERLPCQDVSFFLTAGELQAVAVLCGSIALYIAGLIQNEWMFLLEQTN